MKEFYRYLQVMKNNADQVFALATVIRVEGSAYRHEGAKMLLASDGEYWGTISAGCLEDDLQFHAKQVINSGESTRLTYDLRSEDDLGWGQGAGCNGKIEVYVEAVQYAAHQHSIWPEVLAALNQGLQVASVRGINGLAEGAMLFLTEQGQLFGNVTDPHLIRTLEQKIHAFSEKQHLFCYEYSGEMASELLFERLEPKDYLYIFGAGPDAEPLVSWAAQLDFYPIVIDPRESRCNRKHFPAAGQVIVAHPDSFLAEQSIRPNSFVIIMTHSFMRDQKILAYFLQNQPKYLGVLGPKRRTNRLIHPLTLPDWVHTPIGLSIGAEGAEEISISILAELIQVRNRKEVLIS